MRWTIVNKGGNMRWALDEFESWACQEDRLAKRAASVDAREFHSRAAAVFRSRAGSMRSGFRASLGLARHS
jgi:hypothetical protein